MIGTDTGNVHNFQQGQGLATVVNQNALLEDALWQKKAGLLEKQRKKQEAISDFDSLDPKFSYLHQQEKLGYINRIQDKYISLQEKGVDNPFRATDPESQALQKEAKEALAVGVVSEEIGNYYTKIRDIFSDQEKVKKIKNVDEIKQWFHEVSATKVFKEKTPFPEIEFISPAFNTLGTTYELAKTWNDVNKRTMSKDEAIDYAGKAMTDPSLNEPDGYFQAMKQTYNELMPEDKQRYIGLASTKGKGTFNDELKFFVADQIWNASGGEVDLGEIMAEDAKKLNVSGSGNKEGDKWTYVKGGEKEYAAKRAHSKLKLNIGQIERDVEKRKLYGDVNNTPEQNYDAAFDYYYPIYLANITREFDPANTSGSGGADAEAEAGFNRWLYNLTQGNDFERKDAAMFGFGAGDPQEGGVITSAEVFTPEMANSAFTKDPIGPATKEFPLTKIPQFKHDVLVVDVKDKSKLTALQESNFVKDYGEDALEIFRKMSGKKDIVIYELNEKNTQALRKFYKNSATSQGGHYKPTQQSIESTFFDE